MRDCPPGAIGRSLQGEVFISDACIGCGNCERLADYDPAVQKKAVKCDLCKDLKGGPSCVRACPTGAAIRISPEKFFKNQV